MHDTKIVILNDGTTYTGAAGCKIATVVLDLNDMGISESATAAWDDTLKALEQDESELFIDEEGGVIATVDSVFTARTLLR